MCNQIKYNKSRYFFAQCITCWHIEMSRILIKLLLFLHFDNNPDTNFILRH